MGKLASWLPMALAMCGLSLPAHAQMGATAEIRDVWAQCQEIAARDADAWIGWRHDFNNGYRDDFQFHDHRFDEQPSRLLRYRIIDAIAVETTISCFRADKSLAFVFTAMSSPNIAGGTEEGPVITREGRIYVAPDGEVVDVLARIVDDTGKKVGFLDDDKLTLARGCSPVDLYRSADDVEREYFSVLGEIDGTRPDYVANELDWCAIAKEQD